MDTFWRNLYLGLVRQDLFSPTYGLLIKLQFLLRVLRFIGVL